MDELAVEVCGENGAYYKVRTDSMWPLMEKIAGPVRLKITPAHLSTL